MKFDFIAKALVVFTTLARLWNAPAQNLAENGSFEFSNNRDPGSSVTLISSGTAINNWTVISPGIGYVGTIMTASEGRLSIHLNLGGPGKIEQVLPTVAGQRYRVYYDVSAYVGPNGAGARLMSGKASAIDNGVEIARQDFTFDGTGRTFPNVGWAAQTFSFAASSAQTTLRFESTTAGSSGPSLDNVRVVPGRDDGSGNWIIDGAPVFSVRMPSQTRVALGGTMRLSVTAMGGEPITYQWYSVRNNTTTLLAGETNPSFELANISNTQNNMQFYVVALNTIGTVTNRTSVAVVSPPRVVTAPVEQRVSRGDQLTLNASINNSPESYQWYKDGEPVIGQTSATFSKTAELSDAGVYHVSASNVAGSVSSDPVPVAVIDGPVPPWIRTERRHRGWINLQEGSALSIDLNVEGAQPRTFRWHKDDSFLVENSGGFFRSPAQIADSGTYHAVISNAGGTFTSESILVQVYPPQTAPQFATSAQTVSAAEGSTVTFEHALSAGTHVNFQWWRRDVGTSGLGMAVEGANALQLTLQNLRPENAGIYTLVATNFVGSAQVETRLNIVELPRFTGAVTSFEGPPGINANIQAALAGSVEGMTFQWMRGDQPVEGATSQAYQFVSSEALAGTYRLVARNAAGEATSPPVSIVVRERTAAAREFQLVADRTVPIPEREGATFNALGNAELRNGVVTFHGRNAFSEINAIYRWEDGAITRVVDGSAALPTLSAAPTFITGLSAEEAGFTYFVASSDNAAPDNQGGIFSARNGVYQNIVNQLSPTGVEGITYKRFGFPTHAGGKVAFLLGGDSPTQTFAYSGLFVWNGNNIERWWHRPDGLPAGSGVWGGNSAQVGFDGNTIAVWLIDSAGSDGIYATSASGPLRKIAFRGEPVPGTAHVFNGFSSPPLVHDGKIAFLANTSGGGALVEWNNGALRLIALAGANTAGDGTFNRPFFRWDYDADGSIVFTGVGPGSKNGIYRHRNGVFTEELTTLNTILGRAVTALSLVDIDNGQWLINASLDGVAGLYVSSGGVVVGPEIQTERTGNVLRFSWGRPGRLQESTNMVDWADVTPEPVTSAEVAIQPSGLRFFRIAVD